MLQDVFHPVDLIDSDDGSENHRLCQHHRSGNQQGHPEEAVSVKGIKHQRRIDDTGKSIERK